MLSIKRLSSTFIPRFKFPEYNIPLTDFKGHQRKAILKFHQLLPQLNLLLELRDIRAPLSTRNVIFDDIILKQKSQNTQRVILYSKSDQGSPQTLKKLQKWHDEMGDQFMVLDCRSTRDVKNLIRLLQWKYDSLIRETLGDVGEGLPLGYRVLVAGMPNVGKSSLVNTLRFVGSVKTGNLANSIHDNITSKRKKVAQTGGQAGVTRKTSECIKISDYKGGIYLYDTPGVSLPGRITTREKMLSLSLCGCIKSNLVDPVIQADYLLYLMNLQQQHSNGRFAYEQYTRGQPTNDIYRLLRGIQKRAGIRDDTGSAIHWVDKWRQGKALSKGTMPISFDIETLLDDADFSYEKSTKEELSLLQEWSIAPAKRTTGDQMAQNVNQLFKL